MIIKRENQKSWEKENFYGGEGTVVGRAAIGFGNPRPEGSPIHTTVNLTIPVDGSVGNHIHKGQDEMYFVISGSGTHTTEEDTCEIAQHDVIYTLSGQVHTFVNTGNEPMILQAVLIEVNR